MHWARLVNHWRRWQSRRGSTDICNRSWTGTLRGSYWSLNRLGSFNWGRCFEGTFSRMWFVCSSIAIVDNLDICYWPLLRRWSGVSNGLLDRLRHHILLWRLMTRSWSLHRLRNRTWLDLSRSWSAVIGTHVRVWLDIGLRLRSNVVVVLTSTIALVIALHGSNSFNLEWKLRHLAFTIHCVLMCVIKTIS